MENRQNNYQQPPRHVVCLKNIPRNMVKDDIQKLCASFGRVENINDTKSPYMFVRMATLNDFERVLQGFRNNQHGIVAEAARKSGGTNNNNNTSNYNGNVNNTNDHMTKRHNDYNQRQNDFNQRQNDFNQGLKNTSVSSPNNRTMQNYPNRSQFQNSQDRNSFDNNIKKESSTTSDNKPNVSSKGQCRICRKSSHLVCQRCGEFYCSIECQCVDWPGHKYICIPMPKLVDLNSPEVGVVPGIPAEVPILKDIVPGKENNHMQQQSKANESPENTKNTVVTNDTSSQKKSYHQERHSSSFPNKHNNLAKPIVNKEENVTPPRKDYNATKVSPNKKDNIKPSPNKDNTINNNANNEAKIQKPKEIPAEKKTSVDTSKKDITKPIKNFPKSGSTVSLTFLCKSNQAYIRPLGKEENDVYLDVINKINTVGETAKKLGKMPKVGDIIITNFQDMGYYRAKILNVDNEENITVTYLDFGNTELKKFTELKEMPKDLLSLDRCIYPVILKNVPDFSVNDALMKFINTYVDNLVELKLVYGTTANTSEVELFDLSTNACLNKKILEFNKSGGKTISDNSPVMTKDITIKSLPTGKNIPVFITDNSLLETNLISCVHESDLPIVDKYNQEFDAYARKVKEPHTPRLSEVCLAQFDEDQIWYRAECIELDDKENPSVVFMDFGNFTNVNVSKIRKYPKELIRPCHTICCVIADLPDELSEKAAERLKQLIPANEKVFVDKIEAVESTQTTVLYMKKVVDILKSEKLI